jgi:D-3-phosphoglycerate dehydrogenase
MLNKSRQDIAVTLLDVDKMPGKEILARVSGIKGVLSVRCLGCAD